MRWLEHSFLLLRDFFWEELLRIVHWTWLTVSGFVVTVISGICICICSCVVKFFSLPCPLLTTMWFRINPRIYLLSVFVHNSSQSWWFLSLQTLTSLPNLVHICWKLLRSLWGNYDFVFRNCNQEDARDSFISYHLQSWMEFTQNLFKSCATLGYKSFLTRTSSLRYVVRTSC